MRNEAMQQEAVHPIAYPALHVDGLSLSPARAANAVWCTWAIKNQRGKTWEMCDSNGNAFLVGSPTPLQKPSIWDRILNRMVDVRFSRVESLGPWSLEELKARVIECLEADREFYEETQPVELWKLDLENAKTHRDVINLFL
jgi:hypothetical protein